MYMYSQSLTLGTVLYDVSSSDHRLMSLPLNLSSPCYRSSITLLNTVLMNVTWFIQYLSHLLAPDSALIFLNETPARQENNSDKARSEWSSLATKPHYVIEPPHDKTNKMTCAPTEYSDQPGHPPGLIRVFAVRSHSFFMQTAKTLIRLGGCPGWFESSLGVQVMWWFYHAAAEFNLITYCTSI